MVREAFLLVTVGCLAVLPPAARADATQPNPPPVADGAALVRLVRTSMREYLKSRTPAGKQTIPANVEAQAGDYTVVVMLRRRGLLVARSVQGPENLYRSLVAASLQAMRSPSLGDRVTAELLDSLTVEVVVLGRAQRVFAEPSLPVDSAMETERQRRSFQRRLDRGYAELRKLVAPGWTTLMLSRGDEVSYTLGCEAYELGMDIDRMRRNCIAQIPPGRQDGSLPMQWSVIGAKHYVGYPDGWVLWLFRGKVLTPAEAIDESTFSAAAARVGRYLLHHQRDDGAYCLDGDEPSLADHLRATRAVARLAQSTSIKNFAASANAALGFAGSLVSPDGQTGQLAETALLALAIERVPRNRQAEQLYGTIIDALRRAVRDDGSVSSRLGPGESPPADTATAAMVLAALYRSGRFGRDDGLAKALGKIVPGDDSGPQAPIPARIQEIVWIGRALNASRLGPNGKHAAASVSLYRMLAKLQRPGGEEIQETLLDEVGAFAWPGEAPRTAETAQAAAMLVETAALWKSRSVRTNRSAADADARKARVFCYQMVYKPREAYFAEKPNRWQGGVRARPSSAKVSLNACAATIEALMGK